MTKYLLSISLLFAKNYINIEYNHAVKLYNSNKFQDSRSKFEMIVPKLDDSITKSKSYFYIANIYFKSGEYLQSIDYYKNALRQNSTLKEAKYNLALARNILNNQKNNIKQQQNFSSKDSINNSSIINNSESNSSNSTKNNHVEEFLIKAAQIENSSRIEYYKNAKTAGKYYKKNW